MARGTNSASIQRSRITWTGSSRWSSAAATADGSEQREQHEQIITHVMGVYFGERIMLFILSIIIALIIKLCYSSSPVVVVVLSH